MKNSFRILCTVFNSVSKACREKTQLSSPLYFFLNLKKNDRNLISPSIDRPWKEKVRCIVWLAVEEKINMKKTTQKQNNTQNLKVRVGNLWPITRCQIIYHNGKWHTLVAATRRWSPVGHLLASAQHLEGPQVCCAYLQAHMFSTLI